MMNKIKSGIIAKLKAIIAIPIILAVFFLFADLTVDKTELSSKSTDFKELSGSWKSLDNSASMNQIIKFEGNKLVSIKAIKESNLIVDNYQMHITRKWLKLKAGEKQLRLKYNLTGNHLRIWWSKKDFIEYEKSPENFNYVVIGADFMLINRPKASTFKEIDISSIRFRLAFDTKNMYVNDLKCDAQTITSVLKKEKEQCCKDEIKLMASIDIHSDAKMKEVESIIRGLQENNILKVAYLVEPNVTPAKSGNSYGLLRLLPPLDVILLDETEIQKQGIKLFKIDISSNIPNLELVKTELKNFVRNSDKYMMQLLYSDNTSYNTFIAFNDLVNIVFNEVRNEFARSAYQQSYNSLPEEKQNEVKKKFPQTLTTAKK